MRELLKIGNFKPFEDKVTLMGQNNSPCGKGVAFAFDISAYESSELGLIIYENNDSILKFPFDLNYRVGDLIGIYIENLDITRVLYNFYADNDIINDPNALGYEGNDKFGCLVAPENIKSVFFSENFDWGEDTSPRIPYKDSIFYGLNVRAFTKDPSSKVSKKGTFEGIIQKIPYLKDLGITGLVLMPSYEFDECENARSDGTSAKSLKDIHQTAFTDPERSKLLNCWGFTKGYYYAPKTSYSWSNRPWDSFKTLVKELHQNSIEVIMQFYFPQDFSQGKIVDILKFWVSVYHVDGFRLNGFYLPYRILLNDPFLAHTKLWFNYIPHEDLDGRLKENVNLSSDHGNFRYDIRRFLKGDEGLLNDFIHYQKDFPKNLSLINYLCDYDGFSLMDLYSYERKHNENNLESNFDGNNMNFSWNCGVEGESKKKNIIALRKKQIKNALSLLMLCHGTPYIFSGDEFGNTRMGNNNAYCQDNATGYVKWKANALSSELLEFTRNLIKMRRNAPIFHTATELTNMDSMSIGYPDLSYHGIEAYRPDLGFNSRMLGMFFCGNYSDSNEAKSYYVAVNMHWEKHRLAVPKLKKGKQFKKIIDTGESSGTSRDNEIPIGERSVAVFEVTEIL